MLILIFLIGILFVFGERMLKDLLKMTLFTRIQIGPEAKSVQFTNASTVQQVKQASRIARLCGEFAEVTSVEKGHPEFAEAVYDGKTVTTRIHAHTCEAVDRLRGLMVAAANYKMAEYRLLKKWNARPRPVAAFSFAPFVLGFVPTTPSPVSFGIAVIVGILFLGISKFDFDPKNKNRE